MFNEYLLTFMAVIRFTRNTHFYKIYLKRLHMSIIMLNLKGKAKHYAIVLIFLSQDHFLKQHCGNVVKKSPHSSDPSFANAHELL